MPEKKKIIVDLLWLESTQILVQQCQLYQRHNHPLPEPAAPPALSLAMRQAARIPEHCVASTTTNDTVPWPLKNYLPRKSPLKNKLCFYKGDLCLHFYICYIYGLVNITRNSLSLPLSKMKGQMKTTLQPLQSPDHFISWWDHHEIISHSFSCVGSFWIFSAFSIWPPVRSLSITCRLGGFTGPQWTSVIKDNPRLLF